MSIIKIVLRGWLIFAFFGVSSSYCQADLQDQFLSVRCSSELQWIEFSLKNIRQGYNTATPNIQSGLFLDDEINGSCNFGDHNIEWSAKAIKNQAEYMCGAADMGYRISVSIGGKLVLSSVTLADSLWCSRGVSSVELNGYYRCDLRKPGGCIEMHLSPVKEDVFIDYNGPIDMEWLDKYLCTDKCSKYVYVSNVALEIKPLKE